ncbi:DsbA family protein [Ginsengibacter hankyongi]|uniref:DsbA family protein n=1 Tax=Ginsengibacter hankyongi TaxID=2607284 RepID=A0A5J5IK39_9BACT|nr:DsbA family protein [Ginsengibacter hankyongi]KAA9039552.1 DsbA family protein [Ginsengibacter hankyongi]
MTPTLIYCYDAYCGWCYGFSEVIKKVYSEYKNKLEFEVLSGGMILPEEPVAIVVTAKYIESAYKRVEELSGAKFGEDYLWHIRHPDQSDWFPNSEKPAIALCVFKEYVPNQQVSFAADMQYALHFEGRDLTDDEAYLLLLEKYNIPAEEFYEKLHDEEYKEQAYYEFALCKQLNVTGFPAVFIQTGETKFHHIAQGYTPFDSLNERIENVLKEKQ